MDKQITLLIADDNDAFRTSLKILIVNEEEILLVGEAKNGEETIAMAAELLPQIILMDINMSPVNGFEATRKILKTNPAIKIIGLSLHKESSYCINLLRLGARGYLIKTASHTEVIAAIREVAAGRKYIDKQISGISQ